MVISIIVTLYTHRSLHAGAQGRAFEHRVGCSRSAGLNTRCLWAHTSTSMCTAMSRHVSETDRCRRVWVTLRCQTHHIWKQRRTQMCYSARARACACACARAHARVLARARGVRMCSCVFVCVRVCVCVPAKLPMSGVSHVRPRSRIFEVESGVSLRAQPPPQRCISSALKQISHKHKNRQIN